MRGGCIFGLQSQIHCTTGLWQLYTAVDGLNTHRNKDKWFHNMEKDKAISGKMMTGMVLQLHCLTPNQKQTDYMVQYNIGKAWEMTMCMRDMNAFSLRADSTFDCDC